MKTLAKIENPTLCDIKKELQKMYEEENYEANYGFQWASFLEMWIMFSNGTTMKLAPTFWSPLGFSGFHYSFSCDLDWLDGEDDLGETDDTTEWLDKTIELINSAIADRGNLSLVTVVADEIDNEE